MKKLGKTTGKLIWVASILALTGMLIAACGPAFPAEICHATGDPTTPYEKVTITDAASLNEHRAHTDDIIPAPAGGCPATLVSTTPEATNADGKITICHATGSTKNPYVEITVSVNGLNGHGQHTGDIIPAPADGCPTTAKP